jgi:regulatory protein
LVNQIISELIEENYLNEERFAKAFVRGKFTIKKWGRSKIKRELYPHKLSVYLLKKAFEQIDEKEYDKTLRALIDKKNKDYQSENEFQRKGKVAAYCIHRGFEPDLVWDIIKEP